MTNLDSSKCMKINGCYSRQLEEVFIDDYPGKPEQEREIEPGNGEYQIQNQDPEQLESVEIQLRERDGESLPSKVEPRINDCGLNPVHSKRIEGTQIHFR